MIENNKNKYKKQAKYDINLMKEELKRLKTIEKNTIRSFNLQYPMTKLLSLLSKLIQAKGEVAPEKQTAILNDIRNHLIILVSKFQTIRTSVINKIFVLSINIHL